MLKQNFQRMVTGSKFAAVVIGILIILFDVLHLPLQMTELMEEASALRFALFAALTLGYVSGRHLRLDDPNRSMLQFWIWANIFRTAYMLIASWLFYTIALNNEEIDGPFAVFVCLISAGLYANAGYTIALVVFNAIIYGVIIFITGTDFTKQISLLFCGYAVLASVGFSAVTLFRSFAQEFAMTKQTEEERRIALELNEHLHNANEEIQRQMSLLSEQAREIEIANTMLQERGLELSQERDKAERLLHNILPRSIAQRLQAGEETIASSFDNVSVLFADIVGFTQLAATRPAAEIVSMLNRIFSAFDIFSEQYNLEKIKTIGDAYMIVGGLPEPRADHCVAVVRMALEMHSTMELLSKTLNIPLSVRIGIHTGSVVAGVIGKKKFAYDLWGDTVNTASRMESHGEAGKIHISDAVYCSLAQTPSNQALFLFEERGEIEIKGKGKMRTWFVAQAQ
ncbi:MAG: hypothetical protein EAZ92_13215 [Candidatus Kapaibacterium sp.]|nr:MAG: hypothetical protein EAZ92_13215 [Candidatus Kapabacteria bacterium]